MSYAAKYPTLDDAEASFADGELDSAIAALPTYRERQTILTISEDVVMTAAFLRALAAFAEAVEAQLGAKLTFSGREFSRDKSADELRKAACEERRSDMYYHPEKYGLPTKDEA